MEGAYVLTYQSRTETMETLHRTAALADTGGRFMILGIVGAEAAKFTAEGQTNARELIESLYRKYKPKIVVSGACHLGGIDIWARKLFDGRFKEFPPEKHSWTYYKRRNIQIAEYADRTICIAVDRLPPGFKGMRFRLCYHCGTTD